MLPFVHKLVQVCRPLRAFFIGAATMAFLALFIVPALAQEVAKTVPSGWGSAKEKIIALLVTGFLAAAAFIGQRVIKILGQAFDALEKWLRSKIENEFIEGAFLRLAGLGRTVVLNTWRTGYQATKESLKKALADGKVEKHELIAAGNNAKKQALTQLRAITPKSVLRSILGKKADTDPVAVDDLLGAVIEGAVHDSKLESKAANAVAGASGGK